MRSLVSSRGAGRVDSRGLLPTMAAMPYPDKFHAAVRAAKVSAHNARFSDETKLLLYALDSQARNGACPVQSKWQMSAEDRAKYETWQNLGKMDAFEAMRLYVKLLDEEVPGWWRQPRREDEDARDEDGFRTPSKNANGEEQTGRTPEGRASTPNTPAPRTAERDDRTDEHIPRRAADRRQRGSGGVVLSDLPAGLKDLAPGRWARPNLNPGGPSTDATSKHEPPAARHQHGAVVAGSKMYVVGGARQGGRLGSDAHELNLATLRWRTLDPPHPPVKPDASPPDVKASSTRTQVGWLGRVLGLDDDEFASPGEHEHSHSSLVTQSGALPPCAGHRLFTYHGAVYLVGGTFKDGVQRTRDSNDAQSHMHLLRMNTDGAGASWESVKTRGHAPTARRCASATVVGLDTLLVYGGECVKERRPLGDAHALDLRTMTWRVVSHSDEGDGSIDSRDVPVPTPRSEHVACAFGDDGVLVFGGAGASHRCLGDVWLITVSSGRWRDLTSVIRGPPPDPRAGHAGVVIMDRYWCIVGGGNGRSGVDDSPCAVLDLDTMEWCSGSGGENKKGDDEKRTPALPSPAVVGEGMSLCAVETWDGDGVLIAFGGYDGKCREHAQAFRFPRTFPDGKLKPKEFHSARKEMNEISNESPGVAAAVARGLGAMFSPMKIENNSATAASSQLRVDALTADNLRLRRENAQIREDARRVMTVQRTMESSLEQTRMRCEQLEKALRESRVEAARGGERVKELELAAEGLRARIKKLENGDESDTEESPAPNKRGNWFMNLLADTPENTP